MNCYLEKQIVTTFAPHYNQQSILDNSNPDNNEYIFDIILSFDNNTLAASRSDHSLLVIDSNQLNVISKVIAHSDRINHIEYSIDNPFLLFSTSDDKKISIWDQRIFNQPVSNIYQSGEVLSMALGADGYLLASTCDSSILFYDIRYLQNRIISTTSSTPNNAVRLGQYADVHSDIVTNLKFHPIHRNILASASEDGLICVYDTSVKETDESVITILNTECPIAKFGYFGEDKEGIYAISTIETLSCWHYPSAQRIVNFSNIRIDHNVDYLVDCFEQCESNSNTNSNSNNITDRSVSTDLYLLAGCNSGTGKIIKIEPSKSSCIKELTNNNYYNTNGHTANIRCCINNNQNNMIYTGGEDARICKWNNNNNHNNNDNNNNQKLNRITSNSMKTKSKNSDIHFKPY